MSCMKAKVLVLILGTKVSVVLVALTHDVSVLEWSCRTKYRSRMCWTQQQLSLVWPLGSDRWIVWALPVGDISKARLDPCRGPVRLIPQWLPTGADAVLSIELRPFLVRRKESTLSNLVSLPTSSVRWQRPTSLLHQTYMYTVWIIKGWTLTTITTTLSQGSIGQKGPERVSVKRCSKNNFEAEFIFSAHRFDNHAVTEVWSAREIWEQGPYRWHKRYKIKGDTREHEDCGEGSGEGAQWEPSRFFNWNVEPCKLVSIDEENVK